MKTKLALKNAEKSKEVYVKISKCQLINYKQVNAVIAKRQKYEFNSHTLMKYTPINKA